MHVSKPHHDAGSLVVNVVNPTGGLLEGDRIECRVEVEAGARLVLTTPSASRAHRVREGFAELRQELRVAGNAFLEFWPELFIPQGGARFRQKTSLSVEDGGELLFFESLAPGRVAAGESFAFRELEWETDVCFAGKLIARERYRIIPGDESVRTLQRAFPHAYYASVFVVAPRLTDKHPCWQRIHELHSGESWIGCGRLSAGGSVIKILAGGSVELRRILQAVRAELHLALDREMPSVRRAGW
jgi:urease accessory protein